jgi:HEAT repeat protein
VLVVVACLAASAALIAFLARDAEPSSNGHTLSYWLEEYAGNGVYSRLFPPQAEFPADPSAVEAISRIGTNALPFLIRRLRYEPSLVKHAISSALAHAPSQLRPAWLTRWAEDDRAQTQAYAASLAFAVLRSSARLAIPDLVRMMNDPKSTNTASLAQCALANIGEDALPYLVASLQDTNAPNRAGAAFYIGAFPPLRTNAGPAIPILIRCLKDKDPFLQCTAAEALGQACLQPTVTVPALMDAAQKSPDRLLRRLSITALGRFGPDARSAAPYLQTALSDPAPAIRYAATNSLLAIAPDLLPNAPAP